MNLENLYDLQNITQSIELLYPKLVCNNKNIIEKSFYLDSKKNNFIQFEGFHHGSPLPPASKHIITYNCLKSQTFDYNILFIIFKIILKHRRKI